MPLIGATKVLVNAAIFGAVERSVSQLCDIISCSFLIFGKRESVSQVFPRPSHGNSPSFRYWHGLCGISERQ